MVLIVLAANNSHIMHERVNGVWTNLLGGAATLAMFAAVIVLVFSFATF